MSVIDPDMQSGSVAHTPWRVPMTIFEIETPSHSLNSVRLVQPPLDDGAWPFSLEQTSST